MKIHTLLDLKKALEKVPDTILMDFGFGVLEDEDDISLCCWSAEPETTFMKYIEKYKVLVDIDLFVSKLLEAKRYMLFEEDGWDKLMEELDEPIGTETKFNWTKNKP